MYSRLASGRLTLGDEIRPFVTLVLKKALKIAYENQYRIGKLLNHEKERRTHVEQSNMYNQLKSRTKVAGQVTFKHKEKVPWKIMALTIGDYTILIFKLVQATHYQGDVRCGTSRGRQCSCMSLM